MLQSGSVCRLNSKDDIRKCTALPQALRLCANVSSTVQPESVAALAAIGSQLTALRLSDPGGHINYGEHKAGLLVFQVRSSKQIIFASC